MASGLIQSGMNPNALIDFFQINDYLGMVNGVDENRKFDGANTWPLSLPTPTWTPTVTDLGSGNVECATWVKYRCSFYNSKTTEHSAWGPVSAAFTATSSRKLQVGAIAFPEDQQVDYCYVYRCYDGDDGDFYYAGSVSRASEATTFDDNTDSDGLNDSQVKSGVAPTCAFAEVWRDRVFYAGDFVYGTGTVAVTNGSATVLGTGTTMPSWTQGMVNKRFRLTGGAQTYWISNIESGSRLTLTKTFAEDTQTAAAYTISGDPYSIYWSNVEKPGEVYALNYLSVGNQMEGTITGLCASGAGLFVFKERATYLVTGEDTFVATKIGSIGCVANLSAIDVHDGVIFFAGEDGIWKASMSGLSDLSTGFKAPASYNWFATNCNLARNSYAWAAYLEKRYHLFFTALGGSVNKNCLIYNVDNKSWSMWQSEVAFNAGCVYRSSGDDVLRFGDDQGYTYVFSYTATDDGVPAGTKSGTATSATATSLVDTGAAFYTTDDGLKGLYITILSGTGLGQSRMITGNGVSSVTVATWTTTPDSTSIYAIGSIKAYVKTKIFGSWHHMHVRRVCAIHKQQATSCSTYIGQYYDQDTSPVQTDTFDQSLAQHQTFKGRRGRFFQAIFGSEGVARPFELHGLETVVDITERYR